MNLFFFKCCVIKKIFLMNKSLYIFSIIFKSFEKIILFLIDGSDEEYEIVEDVYD